MYARISQDRIGAGLGIARQREDCERLIADRGWRLVAVYEDNDISAYSGKLRPGYRRLLGDLQAGQLDAVVAWHTDRLHRSPRELEEWIDACERHGVVTVTVRAGDIDLATAAGRMVARMLGAAARHESEQKGERVRRAREQSARAGKAHGNLGYGYRRDPITGGWLIDLEQAAIVREIAGRLLAGEALRAIAVDLNERGVPTPSSGAVGWRGPNIRQMITAGRYCGWREWTPATTRGGKGRGAGMGELVAPGEWPAILSRDETERLRRLVSDPGRRTGGRVAVHLLSGLLRCGRCSAGLYGHADSVLGIRRYTCVRQPGLVGCGRMSIAGPASDDHVRDALLAALADSPLRPVSDTTAGGDDDALAAIESERRRLDQLAADYAEARITRAEWLRVRDIVAARMDAGLAVLRDRQRGAVLRRLPKASSEIAAAWTTMTMQEQRGVITALIERLVVHPRPRPTRRFDAGRIEIIWRV